MATRRYGLSRGETEFAVLEEAGAAVNADTVEVTVDLAGGMERSEVLQALRYIENWIISHQWPPA